MSKNQSLRKKARSTKSAAKASKVQKNNIWNIFKFGESYTSLILGIVVVVVATVLLLSFVKGKNNSVNLEISSQIDQKEQNASSENDEDNLSNNDQKNISKNSKQNNSSKNDAVKMSNENDRIITGNTYSVVDGDNLWRIAEMKYKSGYNWVDIQKENRILDPDLIAVGMKLKLPKVKAKMATVVVASNTKGQNTNDSKSKISKISGSNYTVVKGDTLWDISVRAYGDGYEWINVSRVNKLSNPNIIHPGNKIALPRNKSS